MGMRFNLSRNNNLWSQQTQPIQEQPPTQGQPIGGISTENPLNAIRSIYGGNIDPEVDISAVGGGRVAPALDVINTIYSNVGGDSSINMTDVGDSLTGAYRDITGVTAASEMEAAQTEAIAAAKEEQEIGFDRSLEQLNPYAVAGGSFLGGLVEGVQSGAYVPGTFNYSGQQPPAFDYTGSQAGGFDYRNAQQGKLNYDGSQQGATGYQGGPEMGSIQSFMGDPSQDPGYQFRLEQGLKAIDRQAAAGGRFGGGQTAKELMRFAQGTAAQGYADDFVRAGDEREAQRFGESDLYTRDLNALELQNQAEQEGYVRAGEGLDRRNIAEQIGHDRSRAAFEDRNLAEQSNWERAVKQQGMDVAREQEGYVREVTGYDYEVDRLGKLYGQDVDMVNIGRNAAGAISNAALGQGSNLANLSIQQGNAQAAGIAGRGSSLGNLLQLGGQGMNLYNSFGSGGGDE